MGMKDTKHITVNTSNGQEQMTIEHYSRWLCLLEAIDFIDKKCDEWGKNMDDVDWVKPIAIQKYIDERFHSVKRDVEYEIDQGMFSATEQ